MKNGWHCCRNMQPPMRGCRTGTSRTPMDRCLSSRAPKITTYLALACSRFRNGTSLPALFTALRKGCRQAESKPDRRTLEFVAAGARLECKCLAGLQGVGCGKLVQAQAKPAHAAS